VAINALEPQLKTLDDAALQAKTAEFRKRLEDGADVDDVLAEAFAVCREAARRALGMRHFDVQLIGGMVLHEGKIAEMATGEGKTLVATLPAYLNSLTGRGVHIVTVNDYLAKRDAQWMGPVYQALGLSVGVIQHEASFLYDPRFVTPDVRMTALRPCSRPEAYRADITYGTNNEFGFDYLRDNMRFYRRSWSNASCITRSSTRWTRFSSMSADAADHLGSGRGVDRALLQDRSHHSEAQAGGDDRRGQALRGRSDQGRRLHRRREIEGRRAHRGRYRLLRATPHRRQPVRSEQHRRPPSHPAGPARARALQARRRLRRQDGQVIIVDEFTGRMMPGRRWSDGLHQAVEAKEAVRIERENQTLATITFQNYFRMYDKLAGMTAPPRPRPKSSRRSTSSTSSLSRPTGRSRA